MTEEGIDELMTSLHDISDFYNSQESVSVPGNPPIPVTSAQINDVSGRKECRYMGLIMYTK